MRFHEYRICRFQPSLISDRIMRVSFNGKTSAFQAVDCRFDSGLPLVKHKSVVLPDIDLSHDDGDPQWHAAGGKDMTPAYNDDGTIRHYRWNGLAPGHYAEYYRLCVSGSWKKTARAYEANPDDVFGAWYYVDGHPVFWSFTRKVHEDYPVNHVSNLVHDGAFGRGWPEITPHKVNPRTRRVGKNKKRNTLLEWWYEFGPSDLSGGCSTHDWELDGGAPSYEGCVLAVARKIHRFYGNDRRLVDAGESYWKNRVVKRKKKSKYASLVSSMARVADS